MKLPEHINKILQKFYDSGYQAYAVGGCVRDLLRKVEPKDYDIAVSALPEQTKQVLNGYKIIETGIKHGTVTVVSEEGNLEVTTFRIDGKYENYRRPQSVTFTDNLKSDLARRDFTINAMAFSKKSGVIDYFGGRSDLKNKIIRCVGNPDKRFTEDALRIMRALRFASVLNFKIEPLTEKALFRRRHLLSKIAGERVQKELCKMLCGNPKEIIIKYFRIFSIFIPEISHCANFKQHSKYHHLDVLSHIAESVEKIEPVAYLRLTMFLHDIGKPPCFTKLHGIGHFYGHAEKSTKIAKEALERLKFDKETTEKVLFLVKNHDIKLYDDDINIKKNLFEFGIDNYIDLIKVHYADNRSKAEKYYYRASYFILLLERTEKIIQENQCFNLSTLNINGNDLKELGYEGAEIGEALKNLLFAVIENNCKNEKSSLISYIKR